MNTLIVEHSNKSWSIGYINGYFHKVVGNRKSLNQAINDYLVLGHKLNTISNIAQHLTKLEKSVYKIS